FRSSGSVRKSRAALPRSRIAPSRHRLSPSAQPLTPRPGEWWCAPKSRIPTARSNRKCLRASRSRSANGVRRRRFLPTRWSGRAIRPWCGPSANRCCSSGAWSGPGWSRMGGSRSAKVSRPVNVWSNAGRCSCRTSGSSDGLPRATMLRSLIAFCLQRRPLVLSAYVAFLGLGCVAFTQLNIEAYPDPAPPIIEIITQWPGQSPEEVERYVTIPVEIAVASTPGLKFIRSNTVYALSFIRLQFEYGQDYYFVRQQTINRLAGISLPSNVQPTISPAGTVSEIFRYQLKGPPGMDLIELKTLQDWVVERRLRIVPGVSDVLVLGGKTKEYQAEIDLNRLMAFGLTLPQVMNAISSSNSNVGGRTLAMGEQSVNVRGLGNVRSLDDIGNIVLTQQNGVPVLLSDVAKVQVGFTPRLGVAGRDDKTDIIFGVVLMQTFERTMDMVLRVRDAIQRLNTDGSLPPGVVIEPFYDRGDLVAITVRTVLHNMLFGIALIFL